MGQIDTDKKLELVHSIRMSQQNNRALLHNREQLLYGNAKPLVGKGEIYGLESAAVSAEVPGRSDVGNPLRSFKIRLLIAVLLFCAFIFLDRTGQSIMGINMEKVSKLISTESKELSDFASNLFDLF